MKDVLELPDTKTYHVGDICFCWYQIIPSSYGAPMGKLDIFWCKILSLGDEYCSCELYFGETYQPNKVKGTFNDVCVADLRMAF